MSNHQNAIIFDGDDTLWPTQIFYDQAKEQFYDLMGQLGFKRRNVKRILAEKDVANVAHLGFSKLRFMQSMMDTYQFFCLQYALRNDPKIKEKVWNIGRFIYDRTPVLTEGAEDILSSLGKSYRLYLYTAGDPTVQKETIDKLEISPYFKMIYIMERKSEYALQNILEEQDLIPECTWMVGNSPRSDINPALKLSLCCIWICKGMWEYDQETLLPGRVWRVSTLREIIPLLIEVDGLKFEK